MSDEKWLRDGLASAVPEPPVNPERAHAAERLARRRRRTTALAVVGTAGAVAAAAVLTAVLASGGGDPDRDEDVAGDPAATAVACPPIKVRDGQAVGSAIDEPDPDAPEAVPEGATSARLCQGPGMTFQAPGDALVTDVDELVAAVNDLEPAEAPGVCTMDLGPGYRIAFGYDDGSTFVVSGQLYGCRTLVVGSGYRADPEAAQAAFLALLEEQGGAEEPSQIEPGDLTCEEPATATAAAVEDLTTAILCITDDRGSSSAPIDAADLDLLVDDIATHQTTGVLRCAAAAPYPFIVGADDSGNRVTIPSECATSWWRLPNGMAWTPSEEATAILDRLVSEARPVR